MIPTTPAVYIPNQTVCDVCGENIAHAEFLAQQHSPTLVCRSFDCKRVMNDKATMSAERFKIHLAFHKQLILERREKTAKRKAYEAALVDDEERQNNKILEHVTRAYPDAKNIHVIAIPTGLTTSTPLDPERRSAYETHLNEIIADGFSDTPSEDVFHTEQISSEKLAIVTEKFNRNAALEPLSDHVCGMCKGGCCAHGGNQAYLTVSTVLRLREKQPDITPDDILNLYMSRVQDETVVNSCINQTATGCAITRDMRSDTCNSYHCKPLHDFHDAYIATSTLPPVLAIQRSHTNWNRFDPHFENHITDVGLINDTGVHLIPITTFEE